MLARHAIALRHERDRNSIAAAGIAAMGQVGLHLRVQILRAYRDHQEFHDAIGQATDALRPMIRETMVAAHLKGRWRATLTAADAMKRTRRGIRLGLQDEAVDFLKRRLNLTDEELRKLAELYTPEAVTVSSQFAQTTQRELERVLAQNTGVHVQEGIRLLRQKLDALGITNTSPSQLETIFRTQTQLAYSAGRLNENADPAVQAILWGYEYVTVGDDRVRPEHAVLNGVRLPKEDSRWNSIMPPNGWNCRCSVIEVFDTDDHRVVDPEPREIDGELVTGRADKGWGFNPGEVFRDVTAMRVVR
jgi:SPP1 gp7 family putative phage head morphogenesis protein